MFHLFLHFLVPAIVVALFFIRDWKKAYLILITTMLVDIDHLLAVPIYDPLRCSINFHPLHGFLPISIYVLLCFHKSTRYLGVGLVIHMILDSIDCQVTNGVWWT